MTALIKYEAARHALREAHSVDEVKDIRDKALAMQAYARQAQDSEFQAWAAEIRLRAERRAGQLLQEMDKAKGTLRRGNKMEPREDVKTLSDLGVTKKQSSEWQKTARVPEDTFESYVGESLGKGDVPCTKGLIAADRGYSKAIYTGENEWYTPSEYVEMAREVLMGIDLDPASSDAAQTKIKADRFFSIEDNGLDKEWAGSVWLNPPYAQPHIADFISKLVGEYQSGRVTDAVLLTHNYTDTAWFHEAAAESKAICFTRGRVKFYNNEGEIAAPTQGQAFFYFGDDVASFEEWFSGIGFVVRPIE